MRTVLFKDGTFGRYFLFIWTGARMKGDPTAYVMRGGKTVTFVVPGESVEFVEA